LHRLNKAPGARNLAADSILDLERAVGSDAARQPGRPTAGRLPRLRTGKLGRDPGCELQ
jgi:hypothetical protein